MKTWIKELDSKNFGQGRYQGKYSQLYQDTLLDEIFSNIPTKNNPPFCVEFGFNTPHLTEGSGANVTRLVLDKQWKCLLLDGENENPLINLRKHFLTPANICDIFREYGVPSEPEFISIDVDSTDLWLFEAVVKQYRAMVFSVEYNSNFPLHAAITFPNDGGEHWQGDRAYGASLKALNMVAVSHGYSLLWVVPSMDAIFVRNDLIDDGTGELCFPLDKWLSCTSIVNHRALKDKKRVSMFMDYGVYTATGGDVAASRKAARRVCDKVLLDSPIKVAVINAKRAVRKIWPKKS